MFLSDVDFRSFFYVQILSYISPCYWSLSVLNFIFLDLLFIEFDCYVLMQGQHFCLVVTIVVSFVLLVRFCIVYFINDKKIESGPKIPSCLV